MIDLIKNSPAAERTKDGFIRQMGVVLNVPAEISDVTLSSDYTELTNYIGTPMTTFENFANVGGASAQMILILSGQSSPVARVQLMYEQAQKATVERKDYGFGNMAAEFQAYDHPANIDLTGSAPKKSAEDSRAAALSFFSKH